MQKLAKEFNIPIMAVTEYEAVGVGRCRRGRRGNHGQGRQCGVQSNDKWQVIGINGTTIKFHPLYRFEYEQWFNILETVCNHLTQIWRECQTNKWQRMSGLMYNQIYQVTGVNFPL